MTSSWEHCINSSGDYRPIRLWYSAKIVLEDISVTIHILQDHPPRNVLCEQVCDMATMSR
jgi:hypothetical protein